MTCHHEPNDPNCSSYKPKKKTSIVDAEKYEIVNDKGFYEVLEGTCKSCGESTNFKCHPGEWVQCIGCGAKLIYFGKVPNHDCVTPSGRIDCHMQRVDWNDGKYVCTFCKQV